MAIASDASRYYTPASMSEAIARSGKKYSYSYPYNLDFKPTDSLHQKIADELLAKATGSLNVMSQRYSSWNTIDNLCRAYVTPDDVDKFERGTRTDTDQEQGPFIITLPHMFANKEALLTYLTSVFLNDYYFQYEGIGPEDTVGALLIQHLVQQQCLRAGAEINLHVQWDDALSYGIGVIAPRWEVKYGYKTQVVPEGYFDPTGLWISLGETTTREKQITWEGAAFDNIDPYKYFPDPKVAAHEVDKMEFVAWLTTETYESLLSQEQRGEDELFNVKYLKHCVAGSKFAGANSNRGSGSTDENSGGDKALDNTIYVLNFYWWLIPSDYDLGDSDEPELWAFKLANDSILIKAKPVDLDYNGIPISVAVPDPRGYTACPVSRLEMLYPLQWTLDWYNNTHMLSLSKSIHNSVLVDPFWVNMPDLYNNSNVITTRRGTWGKGVDGAMKELPANDFTRGHVADAALLADIMERVSGANQGMQGYLSDSAPERRTASEFSRTMNSAEAKAGKMAKMIHASGHRQLGYLLAHHTKQFMTKETWVKLMGTWERQLLMEYGYPMERISQDKAMVTRDSIDIDFDLVPIEGRLPGSMDSQLAMNLLQLASSNPLLAQSVDLIRLFASVARRAGEKNISQFIRIAPTEEVQNEVAAGNLAPLPRVREGSGVRG